MDSQGALSRKAYVDGVLYRPSLEMVRGYYSRTEVLDEILAAMRCWHVRLEPGEGLRHRWLDCRDRGELRSILMRLMDRMERDPRRVKFPYLRIDARRFEPIDSFAPDDLWGCDLFIEKDDLTWRPCWDAVVPVIDVLERMGVHYWLKYSGHNSLHVIVPAECFPHSVGSVRVAPLMPSIGWRLRAYLSRRCREPLGETGFDVGTAGMNMPFTLNEDSGLLNYPVLFEELEDFTPENAAIDQAQVRSFWREFPEEKRGCAAPLLHEALGDFSESVHQSEDGLDSLLELARSPRARERQDAILRLPWFSEYETARNAVIGALGDRVQDVRKAAVKAMAGIDDARVEPLLSAALDTAPPKLARWIHRVLHLIRDADSLRRETASC